MPELIGDDLHGYARCHCQCRCGVPQAVKPNRSYTGRFQKPPELTLDGPLSQGYSGARAEDQVVLRLGFSFFAVSCAFRTSSKAFSTKS